MLSASCTPSYLDCRYASLKDVGDYAAPHGVWHGGLIHYHTSRIYGYQCAVNGNFVSPVLAMRLALQ